MKPITGKILVKPQEVDNKTKSGILLIKEEEPHLIHAEVIAVGKPKQNTESEVEVGDVVVFGKHSGVHINYDGVDYIVINQHDIYLIK